MTEIYVIDSMELNQSGLTRIALMSDGLAINGIKNLPLGTIMYFRGKLLIEGTGTIKYC